MKPTRTLVVFLGVATVTCTIEFTTKATPPSAISFTPVGRATLPAFDIKRKDKGIDWRFDLETDQPIDVATQVVTFQPGGFSGWHTHPGPVFFTVKTGTLTVYEGDDPQCTPLVFPAGTGAVRREPANIFIWLGTKPAVSLKPSSPIWYLWERTRCERTCQTRETAPSEISMYGLGIVTQRRHLCVSVPCPGISVKHMLPRATVTPKSFEWRVQPR